MKTVDAAAGPRSRRWSAPKLIGACVGLAVLSLPLPASIGYDPWAWLVWGREVVDLDLATTGGPSWKPLPVLATSVLSLAGDGLAPALWLVVSRAAALATLALAYRLAARFAGTAGGLVAAALVLLTPDGGPRYLRLLVEGHGAPMAAALGLWAVERHLDRRHGHALVLAAGMALLRPEAWPFLALSAVWLWREEPALRPLAAVSLAAVPVLWFGGDWWGSGDPFHGAGAAQVAFRDETDRVALAVERAATCVVAPAWVLAVGTSLGAWRRGERTVALMGGAAVAWCALVVAMTAAFRYAALSRFFLPAATLLCVVAGIGAVRLFRALPRRGAGVALGLVLLAASAPLVVPRVLAVGTLSEGILERARLEDDLDTVIERAGGAALLTGCGPVSYDGQGGQRPALAWRLDLPLDAVDRRLPRGPGVILARAGQRRDARLAARPPTEVTPLARTSEWAVYAVDCPATTPDS